jgi:hypothetical protein
VAEELITYRVELIAAVDMAAVRKYREEKKDELLADPVTWDTRDLFRAVCFGFVKKGKAKVVAIEEVRPEPTDTGENQPSQEE